MLVFLQCPFGIKKKTKLVIKNKLNRVGGYPPTTKVAGFPASIIMKKHVDSKVYIERLKEEQGNTDIEVAHCNADDVLCDLLKELGYADVVGEYNKIEKWYA